MKVSVLLTILLAKYDHKIIEEFLKSFSIKYFLMHMDPQNNVHFVNPVGVGENESGFYIYNSDQTYICAIYSQTEEEIVEKFQRFMKIRVFL